VSAPFTVWESMSPALGSGLRPSAIRSCSRTAARIFSVTFASSHRATYQYTVSHGGKSVGRCRQEHPVRTTYKIASTISRRGCFSGRPPDLGAGNNGSTSSHC